MPTQAVRLSICRTAAEIANAKTRDQLHGFTYITEHQLEDDTVDTWLNIPVNGLIRELSVHIDANAQPPLPPATVAPPLTLVISTKA